MLKNIILATSSLFLFTACLPQLNPSPNQTTNFEGITSQLTTSAICDKLNDNETLYITDFVNLKDYTNKSELGFILSNALKVNVLKRSCNSSVQIKAFNFTHHLSVGKSGVKMLSNNFASLKTKSIEDDKKVIAGTYTITSTQLILFLKLIDIQTGNTISSSQTSHRINDEILQLDGREPQNEQPYIRKPFHL
jgi:hypothetical protein